MLSVECYIAIPDELVRPAARHACRSVAGCLAAIFDLPHPMLVYVERAPAGEDAGDANLTGVDFDVNVAAAITPSAPNTIWLQVGEERQLVRAVAHEIGHIAELLGYVAEGVDVEHLPQLLANAVGTTYAAGLEIGRAHV